jgi:hypothetical protein
MTVVQLREKITIFAAWLSNFVELFRHWPSPQRSFCTLTQSNSNTSVLHISLVSAGTLLRVVGLCFLSSCRWSRVGRFVHMHNCAALLETNVVH